MDVPQVAEFEVYLDIDGAVEEDEDSVPSENGPSENGVPLESGEQSIHLPWQDQGTNKESKQPTTSSLAPESVSAPSTSGPATQNHESDTEEVDVDTPFDGKLQGQTEVKDTPSSTSKHNLLSTLLSYTVLSSSSGVLKEAAIPKKPAVARKSTTQGKIDSTITMKRPVLPEKEQKKALFQNVLSWPSYSQKRVNREVSNVAKKSTSKQPKPATSIFSAKARSNNVRTGNLLQVKFGHEKYLAKAKAHANASFKNLPKASATMKKPTPRLKEVKQGMPKKFASNAVRSSVSTVGSNTGKKMFPCFERSGDRIACPECDIVVKTYCLRSHLKTVHNLPMKICKKCKITFTDVNLFSEHYAQHLQEMEDYSNIQTDPKPSNPLPGGFQACMSTKSMIGKQPTSTVTSSSCDVSQPYQGVASDLEERDFSDYPNALQIPPPVKKRRLSSSFPAGPLPKLAKLGNEIRSVTNNMMKLPSYPKLPPKPRKPSFQSKKKRLFLTSANRAVSSSRKLVGESSRQSGVSSTWSVPLNPKLSSKPRKPFSSSEFRTMYPPASRARGRKLFVRESEESGSPRERSSSSGSQQSEELSSSESTAVTRSTPTLYNENRKTAIRRQMSVPNSQVLPPLKKTHLGAAAPVTRKYRGKATVCIVSLETASRPYDCKKCLAAFHMALQCPRAFRLHSQSKPYPCATCPAAFTHLQQLHSHQDTCCGSVPLKREKDDDDTSFHSSRTRLRAFSSPPAEELELKVPAKTPGKGQLFQCKKCKETFQYRSVLLRHLSYHSFQYSCGVCKKAFKMKVDLLDHLQIMHNGRMLLRCKYCERKFEDMAEFDKHIFNHKDGTVVPCTVCNKTFSNSRLMQVHLTVDHGVSQYCFECRVCGKRFKNAKFLSIHMRVSHKSKLSVACKVCGRRFKQPKYLAFHMKAAHNTTKAAGPKFLTCRACQKVFHNKAGLGAHFRLRHGVSLSVGMSANGILSDPSLPAPDCPSHESQAQSEDKSTDVQLELRTPVTEIDSRTCQICHKTYSKRKVLLTHYRNFHKIEPPGVKCEAMKCHICGKVLYSLQGLKVHYRVRHRRRPPTDGEEPKLAETPAQKRRFRCGVCCKFFLYSWSLCRHKRLYHRKYLKTTWNTRPDPVQIEPNPVPTKPNPVPTKPNPEQENKTDQYISASLMVNPFRQRRKSGWVCPICSKPFVLRKTMRMHVKADHPKSFKDERFGRRKCHKCKKSCGSKTELFLHLKTCGKEKNQTQPKSKNWKRYGWFNCTMCERVFHWKQNLVRHMHSQHRLSKNIIFYNLSHQKLVQPVESQSSGLMWEHYTASCGNIFLCKICKVCFTVDRSVKRHIQRRHDGGFEGFQCRFRGCKKLFSRDHALINHIRETHPQKSVYSCLSCSTGFETLGDLLSHRHDNTKRSQGLRPSALPEEDYFAQDDDFASFSAEQQECRYRCMTCDMGFHIAREWTKHMQGHADNPGHFSEHAPQHEQEPETKDTVKLSIFDVMSSSSIFSCKFCRTVFKDENDMNHHMCQQPAVAHNPPKKRKKKHKSHKYAPVKCTVCLKLFSPLSIKKHMKRIHSLPMKICSVCNIVFTDLERFSRHMELHKKQEGVIPEAAAAVGDTVDDELNEDSVTFFICQLCGGLFPDADSLASHACTGGNSEDMAVSQEQFEMDSAFEGQADGGRRSGETDPSRMSMYSLSGSQSADDTDSYTESNSECADFRENPATHYRDVRENPATYYGDVRENPATHYRDVRENPATHYRDVRENTSQHYGDVRENPATLYGDVGSFNFQPGIVIESVSSGGLDFQPGITIESVASRIKVEPEEVPMNTMEGRDDSLVKEQLMATPSLSFDDVLMDSPPELAPASDMITSPGPGQLGSSEETGSDPQQALQADIDCTLPTTEPSSYSVSESLSTDHPTNVETGAGILATSYSVSESPSTDHPTNVETGAGILATSYSVSESLSTDHPTNVETGAGILATSYSVSESLSTDHPTNVETGAGILATSYSVSESLSTDHPTNVETGAGILATSYSVSESLSTDHPTNVETGAGILATSYSVSESLSTDHPTNVETGAGILATSYSVSESQSTDHLTNVETGAGILAAEMIDTEMDKTAPAEQLAEMDGPVPCEEAVFDTDEINQHEDADAKAVKTSGCEAEDRGATNTALGEEAEAFSFDQQYGDLLATKSSDSSLVGLVDHGDNGENTQNDQIS